MKPTGRCSRIQRRHAEAIGGTGLSQPRCAIGLGNGPPGAYHRVQREGKIKSVRDLKEAEDRSWGPKGENDRKWDLKGEKVSNYL